MFTRSNRALSLKLLALCFLSFAAGCNNEPKKEATPPVTPTETVQPASVHPEAVPTDSVPQRNINPAAPPAGSMAPSGHRDTADTRPVKPGV